MPALPHASTGAGRHGHVPRSARRRLGAVAACHSKVHHPRGASTHVPVARPVPVAQRRRRAASTPARACRRAQHPPCRRSAASTRAEPARPWQAEPGHPCAASTHVAAAHHAPVEQHRPCGASSRARACHCAQVAPHHRCGASTRVGACRHDLVAPGHPSAASTHERACRLGWACRREPVVRMRRACALLEQRRPDSASTADRCRRDLPRGGRRSAASRWALSHSVAADVLRRRPDPAVRWCRSRHLLGRARVIQDLTQNGHPNESGGHFTKKSGGVLLSHKVSLAVPSAQRALASGFGM